MSAPEAKDDRIDTQHEQLVRDIALKMIAAAEEDERNRRMDDAKADNPVREAVFDKLINVQEDLVRTINLMKVKAAEELERGQRITTENKRGVHDELLRKAAAKQIEADVELERKRQIQVGEDNESNDGKARMATYNRLVVVQEDLLKKIRTMKVDEAMKEERDRRVTEGIKSNVHQQLFQAVGKKQADTAMESERQRRVEESLNEEEIKRRVTIASRLLDVQKELLSTHQAVKPIHTIPTSNALEDMKLYFQEELIRKAARKEAINAMDQEQQRRVTENGAAPVISDARVTVLESIAREASKKEAVKMAEATRQEYLAAEAKSKAQEETLRKVHQKQADRAMDAEQKARVTDMSDKDPPHIIADLKQEIVKKGN